MDKGAGKHIIKTLSNAKNYTHICSLYISEYYADAIKEMALKHVPNRLITSTKQTERGFYPAEYLGEFATEVKRKGLPFQFLPVDNSFIYAEIYVADDTFAAIGSANLTKTGMWKSVEHVVTFDSPADIMNIKSDFERIRDYNTEGPAIRTRFKSRNG